MTVLLSHTPVLFLIGIHSKKKTFLQKEGKTLYVTKTRPFNIMALFMAVIKEKFQMKKNVIFLLFLLDAEIVDTR